MSAITADTQRSSCSAVPTPVADHGLSSWGAAHSFRDMGSRDLAERVRLKRLPRLPMERGSLPAIMTRNPFLALLLGSGLLLEPYRVQAQDADALAALPLDQLLTMQVTGASKAPTTLGDTAAAATVISRDELRALGCRTLADALATVKGVMVTTDRSYSYLGVRGFYAPGDYNTRILLLIDGNRVNDALYDQAYVGNEFPLDLELVDRLEFIPGQASAVYGANALFGVVNVVTRRLDPGAPFVAKATVGTQGERRVRLSDTLAGPGGSVVRWSATSYSRRGEDVAVNDAVTPHGDFDQGTRIAIQARLGGFSLSAISAHRTSGNPAALDVVPGDRRTRNIDDEQLADLGWTGVLDSSDEATLRAFAGTYRYIGRWPQDETLVNEDHVCARWWGAEGRLTSSRLPGQKVTIGAEYQASPRLWQFNADSPASGPPYLDDNSPSRRGAVFAEEQARISQALTLDASVRWDIRERTASQGTGRFALLWHPRQDFVAKAIYGTAYRPPNAFESNYVLDVPGGYERNPDLDRELVRGAELNVEWTPSASDRVSASIYRNVASSLIVQVRDDDADANRFVNQGRVVATGLEAEWQHAWSGGTRLRANVSHVRDAESGTDIPVASYAPSYLANLTMIWPFGEGVDLAGWTRAVSRRGAAGAYSISGLALSSRESSQGLSWSIGVTNVFDRRYADPGVDLTAQPVIRQQGRSVQGSLMWAFR